MTATAAVSLAEWISREGYASPEDAPLVAASVIGGSEAGITARAQAEGWELLRDAVIAVADLQRMGPEALAFEEWRDGHGDKPRKQQTRRRAA